MRDLSELVHSLPWTKLQVSAVWEVLLPAETKMARLFSLLQADADLTEAEAALQLYGDAGAVARLRSLKSKLKERLLSVIFLLEPHSLGFTDRQQAYTECQRRWSTALILLTRRVPGVAVEQLEQMLHHARYFEFTELAMSAVFHLRHYYGVVAGDVEKYLLYRDLYRQYQTLWAVENQAEELYTDIICSMANTRAPQHALRTQAEAAFRRVERHLQTYNSFRLHLHGRLLQMFIYSSGNDYRTVAALCEDALAFFQAKPYKSTSALQVFYYQFLVCCIQLRDFGRGQAIIRQHSDVYPAHSLNWYKVQELYFLLALHTRHYDDAFDLCRSIAQDPKLDKQPPATREMWKIYEAYAQFLARIRRADRRPDPHFRMGKFLNEIPLFSKDRRGMNIPVLIVQMLFDILLKRYDAAIDRMEALSKYTDRYVRKNEHFRSNCFMKMLLQIPQAAFHREAAVRKAQRYRDLLGRVPLDIANQPYEIEIIPYEDLWEMVLDILPRQRVRIYRRTAPAQ